MSGRWIACTADSVIRSLTNRPCQSDGRSPDPIPPREPLEVLSYAISRAAPDSPQVDVGVSVRDAGACGVVNGQQPAVVDLIDGERATADGGVLLAVVCLLSGENRVHGGGCHPVARLERIGADHPVPQPLLVDLPAQRFTRVGDLDLAGHQRRSAHRAGCPVKPRSQSLTNAQSTLTPSS